MATASGSANGVGINYEFVDDTQIGKADLFDVNKAAHDASARWNFVGCALGLPSSSLDVIRKTYQTPEEYLFAVLTEWLRLNYDYGRHGMPTWRKLVEVIEDSAGGNDKDLARKIAQAHPKKGGTAPPPQPYQPHHSYQPPKDPTQPQPEQPQPQPCCLGLKDLVEDLNPVAAKWREVGIQLDVDDDELDAICMDGGRATYCLRCTLKEWLRNDSHSHAEKKSLLLQALQKSSVGERVLARKLEKELQTPFNLKRLINALTSIAAKWYALGIQLDVKDDKLSQFEVESHNVKAYLTQMLRFWLKRSESPSLDEIPEALMSSDVGYRNLGIKLQKKYKGKSLDVQARVRNDSGYVSP